MVSPPESRIVTADELLELLPHRYPMILVDRIIDLVPGKSCRAIKNVSINEPYFQGHYPGKPIMPGVLILEAMAQAGCVILMMGTENKNVLPVIGGIEGVRFRRQVVPGDQLMIDAELLWIRSAAGKFKAAACVDGELAATMEMTFKLLPRDG